MAEPQCKIANHFNAIFIGISLNWYQWDLNFTENQLEMWLEGIRDGRIHDATFTTAETAQKICDEVF